MKKTLMILLVAGFIFGLTYIADYILILIDSSVFGMTGTNYSFITDLLPLTGYSFHLVNGILGIVYTIAAITSIVLLKNSKKKPMMIALTVLNIINILGLVGIIKEYGVADLICLKYYITTIVYIVALILSAKLIDKEEPLITEDKTINFLICLVMVFVFVQPIFHLTAFIKGDSMHSIPADYELVLANLLEISDKWVLRYLVSQLLIVIPVVCLLSNNKNNKAKMVSAIVLLVDSILGAISIFTKYDYLSDVSYDTYIAIVVSLILSGYIVYKNFVKKPNNRVILGEKSNVNSTFKKNVTNDDMIDCPECGTKNDSNALYCNNCGAKISLQEINDKTANLNNTEVINEEKLPETNNLENNTPKKTNTKKTVIIIAIVGVVAVLVSMFVIMNLNTKKYDLYGIVVSDDVVYGEKFGGTASGEATIKGDKVKFDVVLGDSNMSYDCVANREVSTQGTYCSCKIKSKGVDIGDSNDIFMGFTEDNQLLVSPGAGFDMMLIYK